MNVDTLSPNIMPYQMITAQLREEEVIFPSKKDFEEAMRVGIFRIPVPQEVDVKAGRVFAESFPADPTYNQLGRINMLEGFLTNNFQAVRFQFEKTRWKQYFPEEIQNLGNKLHEIGIKVLKSILKNYDIPSELWAEATGGASDGEGDTYLSFNHYDPKDSNKPYGFNPHEDWDLITVLDAHQEGLQAVIDGVWRSIPAEPGFLTINFGYSLQRLVDVKACRHRVVTQTVSRRTSTIVFLHTHEVIHSWDREKKQLVEKEKAQDFYKRFHTQLQGYKNE